jgi:TRAP-type C4-dicarboxylate transport system permease small subunit
LTGRGNILRRLEAAGRLAEDTVLVLILTGMIIIAAGQIVLRNFLNIGFIWSDELLRLLVLWIAVAGAVAASRTNKHISVAVLDRFLPERLALAVNVLIYAFTAAVSGTIAWYSLAFVQMSREFGDQLLGGVPAWMLQLVLPIGFALIAYRYALFTLKELRRVLRPRDPT